MDSLRALFGLRPQEQQGEGVEDDEIFPTSVLDDTQAFRQLMLVWTFCFNDVLDAERLRSSLSSLLDIGDWRKLGGRLRLNKNGRLEIHVPKAFTPERPAFRFSKQELDININDHPLGKNIPQATAVPSLQTGADDFLEFAVTPGAPQTVYDLLDTDLPQMSIRITTFLDATLIALVWPHTLMDALGVQALLEAWSLIVAGEKSMVPAVLGAREDCAVKAARASEIEGSEIPKEELQIVHKELKGLRLLRFILRFIWNSFWNGARKSRTVFLPCEVVTRMRLRALDELEKASPPNGKKPFVSEGDVLAAWSARIVASSEPVWRPMTMVSMINLRFWLDAFKDTSGVYTQNLAVATMTFLTPELAHSSAGAIAGEHRKHLVQQSTQPQLNAALRYIAAANEKGTARFLFGEPDMVLLSLTNLTKSSMFQAANFSAAVIRPAGPSTARSNTPGTMNMFLSTVLKQSMITTNIIRIAGKDHDGNYWMTGMLLPRAWDKMEEELRLL